MSSSVRSRRSRRRSSTPDRRPLSNSGTPILGYSAKNIDSDSDFSAETKQTPLSQSRKPLMENIKVSLDFNQENINNSIDSDIDDKSFDKTFDEDMLEGYLSNSGSGSKSTKSRRATISPRMMDQMFNFSVNSTPEKDYSKGKIINSMDLDTTANAEQFLKAYSQTPAQEEEEEKEEPKAVSWSSFKSPPIIKKSTPKLKSCLRTMPQPSASKVTFGSPSAAEFDKHEPVKEGMTPLCKKKAKERFSMAGSESSFIVKDTELFDEEGFLEDEFRSEIDELAKAQNLKRKFDSLDTKDEDYFENLKKNKEEEEEELSGLDSFNQDETTQELNELKKAIIQNNSFEEDDLADEDTMRIEKDMEIPDSKHNETAANVTLETCGDSIVDDTIEDSTLENINLMSSKSKSVVHKIPANDKNVTMGNLTFESTGEGLLNTTCKHIGKSFFDSSSEEEKGRTAVSDDSCFRDAFPTLNKSKDTFLNFNEEDETSFANDFDDTITTSINLSFSVLKQDKRLVQEDPHPPISEEKLNTIEEKTDEEEKVTTSVASIGLSDISKEDKAIVEETPAKEKEVQEEDIKIVKPTQESTTDSLCLTLDTTNDSLPEKSRPIPCMNKTIDLSKTLTTLNVTGVNMTSVHEKIEIHASSSVPQILEIPTILPPKPLSPAIVEERVLTPEPMEEVNEIPVNAEPEKVLSPSLEKVESPISEESEKMDEDDDLNTESVDVATETQVDVETRATCSLELQPVTKEIALNTSIAKLGNAETCTDLVDTANNQWSSQATAFGFNMSVEDNNFVFDDGSYRICLVPSDTRHNSEVKLKEWFYQQNEVEDPDKLFEIHEEVSSFLEQDKEIPQFQSFFSSFNAYTELLGITLDSSDEAIDYFFSRILKAMISREMEAIVHKRFEFVRGDLVNIFELIRKVEYLKNEICVAIDKGEDIILCCSYKNDRFSELKLLRHILNMSERFCFNIEVDIRIALSSHFSHSDFKTNLYCSYLSEFGVTDRTTVTKYLKKLAFTLKHNISNSEYISGFDWLWELITEAESKTKSISK